jgi:hypothetical protein
MSFSILDQLVNVVSFIGEGHFLDEYSAIVWRSPQKRCKLKCKLLCNQCGEKAKNDFFNRRKSQISMCSST